MKSKITSQGFTILNLTVLIAFIAIITAIFYPTFIRSTKSITGSSILSDMRNIENAEMKYYIKYGDYPDSYTPSLEVHHITENQKNLIQLIDGKKWPSPPLGDFIIENTDTHEVFRGTTTRHSYYNYAQNDVISKNKNGISINNIIDHNKKELNLTFIDLLQ